jgi:hypothetical protein
MCKYDIVFTICWFIILLDIIGYFIDIDFFNDYNEETRQILNKYGDYKIKEIYIVKQPISRFLFTMLNIGTLYEYQRITEENEDFVIYHASIIVKIKLPNNLNKFLLIEKNPSMNISEKVCLNKLQNIKSIRVKNYTLNKMLNTTNERMGNKRFFNWNFYKNNCQDFVKEILITLKKPHVMDDFMDHKKITNWLYSSQFNVYAINFVATISNIIEKYLFKYY